MSLRENLKQEAAQALRLREPLTASSDLTVGDAIKMMRERCRGCVIVTEGRRPIGILTERDILTKVLANNVPLATSVADVMTGEPSAIREGDTVGRVIRAMNDGGFRNMPVVDGSGFLKGVVSIKRIVEYLVEHFPAAVFNLPPQPKQGQAAREGA